MTEGRFWGGGVPYIYIRNCNICKFKNVKNPQFFVPGIFYLWGSRIYIYIYIRNCISNCPLNIIFYLWISRIYIYIRKTVMLNHVYQIYNSRILAFNILSVDPRFFNILTSSPLLYVKRYSKDNQNCWKIYNSKCNIVC